MRLAGKSQLLGLLFPLLILWEDKYLRNSRTLRSKCFKLPETLSAMFGRGIFIWWNIQFEWTKNCLHFLKHPLPPPFPDSNTNFEILT